MLRPRGDRIVVKKVAGEDKTAGGVILVEKEDLGQATVLAVGTADEISDLNVGDIVVHAPYGGVQTTDPDHGDVMILRDNDVIAVVE